MKRRSFLGFLPAIPLLFTRAGEEKEEKEYFASEVLTVIGEDGKKHRVLAEATPATQTNISNTFSPQTVYLKVTTQSVGYSVPYYTPQ